MKNAALQAMEKIKLYYQRTDAAVFTVATLIDPRLKLSYHKEHKWEKSFIDAARRQFEMVFKNHYYQPPVAAKEVDEVKDDLFSDIYLQNGLDSEQDEVELYLAAARASSKTDILQWWKVSRLLLFYLFILNIGIFFNQVISSYSPMKLIIHN
jgi:hypothetical protein